MFSSLFSNNNNVIKMATIAVELYNWHSKTTNGDNLIKKKYDLKYNKIKRCMNVMFKVMLVNKQGKYKTRNHKLKQAILL